MNFLSHRVTAEGIAPDPGKVEALSKMPMPTIVSQLRSLMGGVWYYRKLLPKMAAVTKTLNSLLKKGVKFEFTLEHTQIVQDLYAQLASSRVLAFPDFAASLSGDRPFQLITDASADGLGAVIEQDQSDGTNRPTSFCSRSTLPNEKNWSTTEMECMCSYRVGSQEKSTAALRYTIHSDKRSSAA